MQMQTPPPLSAPDIDLRGYEFMPLFGTKLFGSDLYDLMLQNPRAGLAAFKLWWEAYARQCPAGSLPNDDRILARLSDFGSDLRGWKKVRATALHGFVLCSDGRLYHPLLCDEATRAFDKRRRDRERKRSQKALFQSGQVIDIAEDHPSNSDGMAPEFRCTGQDRTGQDRTGEGIGEKDTNQSIASYNARVAMLSIIQQSNRSTAATAEAAAAPRSTNTDGRPENSPPDQRRQPTNGSAAGPLDQSSPGQRPPASPPNSSDTRPRHLNPRACDPPHVWIGSGLSRSADGMPRTTMDEMVPHLVAGRGIRTMVDVAARRVCEIALIEPTWRGDWETLVGWLDEGFALKAHIAPAITEVVTRQQDSPRGYRQPSSLRYFTAAIREYAKRQVAA